MKTTDQTYAAYKRKKSNLKKHLIPGVKIVFKIYKHYKIYAVGNFWVKNFKEF